ncbi:hypothetical protein PsYK624_144140 [Phanerochaete sordida]|uniref:Uncharacterized protein n=1 Tax=Phanerochaete sordida TaxID=48140 RepID=A0A9P3GNY9_9APHY|nr:hypothetical protein PsYK624_144140 [Phanerochaete sordida]
MACHGPRLGLSVEKPEPGQAKPKPPAFEPSRAKQITKLGTTLAKALAKEVSAWSGIEETLPLVLTTISEDRLTVKDVQLRLHDNPIRFFGLLDQAHTQIEVVVGRKTKAPNLLGKRAKAWSPAESGVLNGAPTHQLPPAQPLSALHGPINMTHLTPHRASHRKHILSVKQFMHKATHNVFSLAHDLLLQVERNGTLDILRGKRCGGEVVQLNVDISFVLKGETLADTICTLGC